MVTPLDFVRRLQRNNYELRMMGVVYRLLQGRLLIASSQSLTDK